MEIHWLCIPKGVVGDRLSLTVMPVFDQTTFEARGPFNKAKTYDNWAKYVQDRLKTLTVTIAGTSLEPLPMHEITTRTIDHELWEKFFHNAPSRKDVKPHISASGASLHIKDATSAYAKASQSMIRHLIALHIDERTKIDLRKVALQGSVPIDKLFATPNGVKSIMPDTTNWKSYLQQGYSQLSTTFLPVKPTLEQRLNALNALNAMKEREAKNVSGDDAISSFHKRLREAYQSEQSTTKLNTRGIDHPVLSAEAFATFNYAVGKKLRLPREDNGYVDSLSTGRFDHPWAVLGVDHLISTVPFRPGELSLSDSGSDNSEDNRLAMLLAEPGLLSKFGLLFDLEIAMPKLDDVSSVSVSAEWLKPQDCIYVPVESKTAISPQGLPVPRTPDSFGMNGLLRLGAKDQFALTDFRFDECFRQLQNMAQSDKNNLSEHSPGANRKSLPSLQFPQIFSHDLMLHWTKLPDATVAQLKEVKEDLRLEDLAIGIRPMLGHINGARDNEAVTWYDLTAKTVTYGVLKNVTRSENDVARDASYTPLYTHDKRHSKTSSVSEILCSWNGWTLGLGMPGVPAKPSLFEKVEKPLEKKHQQLPFRYGASVCMAARLVLRDGSCLNTFEDAAKLIGNKWGDVTNSGNVVAAIDEGSVVPFCLYRWERLSAPVVLHDAVIPKANWWPAESGTRIVVASSHQDRKVNREKSSRYIVPEKSSDMFATWKHGVFDKVKPSESGLKSVELDSNAGFPVAHSSPGVKETEGVYLPRQFGSDRPFPYHPDPLVSRIRVTAIRRFHEKATDGLFVSDTADGPPVSEVIELYNASKWPNARSVKLEVVGVKRAEKGNKGLPLLKLGRSGDLLKVHVPEGERMTLVIIPEGNETDLSSMHAFSHKRVQNLMQAFTDVAASPLLKLDPSSAVPAYLPYLANVTMVEVQHALDRPALQPKIGVLKKYSDGTNGDRIVDQTAQRYSASIEFDPGSTGSIEIHASVLEPQGILKKLLADKNATALHPKPMPTKAFVESFAHQHMEPVLLDLRQPTTPVLRLPVTLNCTFNHEFHDTKHRKIIYWARALRHETPQEQAEAASDSNGNPTLLSGHRVALAQVADSHFAGAVHILASRKPRPPQLKYIVPSFLFHTEKSEGKVRRKRHGRLALHMDGDWYDSGADEKLAVVLLDADDLGTLSYNEVREKFDRIGSFWGADPTRQSAQSTAKMPDHIRESHFPGCSVKKYTLNENNAKLTDLSLILFEPELCREAESWRVEIPIVNPSAVSRPYVRFAFARYQPYALESLELSDIVLAEYAQISDTREVMVMSDHKDDRLIHVTVYGSSFEGHTDSVVSEVTCSLEVQCAPQVKGAAIWVTEGEPVQWVCTVREGKSCWYGQIRIADSTDYHKYRISILEVERYKLDGNDSKTGTLPVYFDLIPVREID